MKQVIRFLTVTVEALLGVALIILNRFAYLRAGMNHHARFKRMTLIRDFLSDTRWIIWLAVAILCVVMLLRSHVPSWYRATGLLLAMAFAILVSVPGMQALTIYYYLFLSGAGFLVLHTLVALITGEEAE